MATPTVIPRDFNVRTPTLAQQQAIGDYFAARRANAVPMTQNPTPTETGPITFTTGGGGASSAAQPAAMTFQAGGQTFTVTGKNADGTLNLKRQDGFQFDNIGADTAQQYGVSAADMQRVWGAGAPQAPAVAAPITFTTGGTPQAPSTGMVSSPAPSAPGAAGAAQGGGMLSTSQYGYTPSQMSATGQTYNPVTRAVSPQELASEQLRQIVDQRSPLMQQAETAGKQYAARRGLLNSSLAAGAAQGEVLRAATPLAQQNAQTVSGVLTGNQNAQNQAAQFNATAAFNREAGNIEAQNAAKVFGATQLADMNKLVTEYGLKNAQLQIAADIQKDQEAFSQGNTLQRAYVDQTNQLMGNYLNGWFRIQESQMTPEEKAAALGEYNATVRTYQNVLNTAFASLPEWADEWGATLTA